MCLSFYDKKKQIICLYYVVWTHKELVFSLFIFIFLIKYISNGIAFLFSFLPSCHIHGFLLKLMEYYERVSGARLHAAYVRPGGVALVSSPFVCDHGL